MVKAREIIYLDFSHFLPLFDILYYNQTKCWYRCPDSSRNYILRKEGFSQGSPFAVFLAALVLDSVIKKINIELGQRATARKSNHLPSNNGLSTSATIMSYIDETTMGISYEDLRYFQDRFKELGDPLERILKPQKCNILTPTTGVSRAACECLYTTTSSIKTKIKTIKSSSTQGSQFNDKERGLPHMH